MNCTGTSRWSCSWHWIVFCRKHESTWSDLIRPTVSGRTWATNCGYGQPRRDRQEQVRSLRTVTEGRAPGWQFQAVLVPVSWKSRRLVGVPQRHPHRGQGSSVHPCLQVGQCNKGDLLNLLAYANEIKFLGTVSQSFMRVCGARDFKIQVSRAKCFSIGTVYADT